jgi:hypothetical protein
VVIPSTWNRCIRCFHGFYACGPRLFCSLPDCKRLYPIKKLSELAAEALRAGRG